MIHRLILRLRSSMRETGELTRRGWPVHDRLAGPHGGERLVDLSRRGPGERVRNRGEPALLEYAFDQLGLNMIWAWVKTLNPRSQAGLRKQGYRDAGRFTWTGFGPDGFENALMFDLLASEWRTWVDEGDRVIGS